MRIGISLITHETDRREDDFIGWVNMSHVPNAGERMHIGRYGFVRVVERAWRVESTCKQDVQTVEDSGTYCYLRVLKAQ